MTKSDLVYKQMIAKFKTWYGAMLIDRIAIINCTTHDMIANYVAYITWKNRPSTGVNLFPYD